MKQKRPPIIVEHAGSGLKMPEALARKIEQVSRSLPRDFTYRRIARKTDSLSLDAGERTDVSVITTDAVDREGECILPAGGDWSTYNRVVTFAHCYDQLPVGSNWWIRARGEALIAKTHYPQKPADWGEAPWLPSAILHLMQQPVPTCTGKSIGFLPLNVRQATRDEIARRPSLNGVPIIDKWMGVEYAVVPVPCNPEAEMQTVAKGMELGLIDRAVMELIAESGKRLVGSALADADEKRYLETLVHQDQPRGSRVRGSTEPAQVQGERYDREELRLKILRQIRETYLELKGSI